LPSAPPVPTSPAGPAPGPPGRVRTEAQLRDEQRANIIAALEAARWRVSGPGGAADLLGLRPTTLADRMRRLGIRRPVA
jgi:transcriptional regulator with GAF, ATPase, and Fis domain